MSGNLEIRTYSRGGRHRHTYAQFLFSLGGKMRIDIEGSVGEVGMGRVAVIPVNHIHDFEPSSDCRLLVLDFEPSSEGSGLPPPVASFLWIEPWLQRLFRWLGDEVEADPRRGREASRIALSGLSLLNCPSQAFEQGPRTRVFSRVEERLKSAQESISIAVAASEVGLGRSQFHQAFKARNGLSPKQFRLLHVFDRAAALLTTTKLTIAEIAYRFGYQNVSSFNRVFKRRFGVTPSEYRSAHSSVGAR
jgi:AraC-like DNA-binding protein